MLKAVKDFTEDIHFIYRGQITMSGTKTSRAVLKSQQ